MLSTLHGLAGAVVGLWWAAVAIPVMEVYRKVVMGGRAAPVVCPPRDLTGKVAIVTGANTGIGYQCALYLARNGAQVVLACRDRGRGEQAVENIRAQLDRDAQEAEGTTGGRKQDSATWDASFPRAMHGSAVFLPLDLGSLQSAKTFAQAFRERFDSLSFLVCNAGLSVRSRKTDENDLEVHFLVNYLGHYLLVRLLWDMLINDGQQMQGKQDKQQQLGGRIVTVSSVMHNFGDADFVRSSRRAKSDWQAFEHSYYADSKLYMLLLSLEINRRLAEDARLGDGPGQCAAIAVNPGAVNSDIWRRTPPAIMPAYKAFMNLFYLTTRQGAAPLVHAVCGAIPRRTFYLTPYFIPFNGCFPCEFMGPSIGAVQTQPRLPDDAETVALDLWNYSEKLVEGFL